MVVIASPNDVKKEREALDRVIQNVNRLVAKYLGLSLQALRWEDTYPGFHPDGPQALIDSPYLARLTALGLRNNPGAGVTCVYSYDYDGSGPHYAELDDLAAARLQLRFRQRPRIF